MLQKIIQIGNSLGLILPQKVREELGINIGDNVTLEKNGQDYLISASKQKVAGGVDAKFMRMVDEFAEEHKDVLQELANR